MSLRWLSHKEIGPPIRRREYWSLTKSRFALQGKPYRQQPDSSVVRQPDY